MANFDIGPLSGQVRSFNRRRLTPSNSSDVFEFRIDNSSRQIGLNLHNLSSRANLSLFFDSNRNGRLDSGDRQVASSPRGDATQVIDFNPTSTGTYFAQVDRLSLAPFYDLDLSSNYDLGAVGTTPVSRSHFNVSASDPSDVFEFDVARSSNIHVNLNNISRGDDVDLFLYRDNGNGVFDADDRLIASARNGSNRDDLIDIRTTAGTYFAEARRFSGSGSATYDIDVSTTTLSQSNLVGGEITLGTITHDVTRTGRLNSNNTVDSYAFSLPSVGDVDITLSGLSSDADIRVIRDRNNNGIVDFGEVVGSSVRGGTQIDRIHNLAGAGDYVLQVYQFSPTSTAYTVNFDTSLQLF